MLVRKLPQLCQSIFLLWFILVPFGNGKIVAAKSRDRARFELVNGGRVIAREGEDTGFPSVVKVPTWVPVDERPSPTANYYMYYGRHRGRYIYMKWAETMTGEWTAFDLGGTYNGQSRRGVFDVDADWSRDGYDHLAHADVFVDDEKRRFVMFYHGKNQRSQTSSTGTKVRQVHGNFAATSRSGLNFNDPITAGGERGHGPATYQIDDIVRDVWIAEPYQRVFRHLGDWYSVSKRAVLSKAPNAEDPLAPNPTDPRKRAWEQNVRPTKSWYNDPASRYRSPACAFVASAEFASHPNNPQPGRRILCKANEERLNHVGINLLADAKALEIFVWVRPMSFGYNDLYRMMYNISDADFQNWDVVRDRNGQVIFEVYLTPEDVSEAVSRHDALNYADPITIGQSDYFVDGDGKQYLSFSFFSGALGGGNEGGEGQITMVHVYPQCSNGIDDDKDGKVDFPDDEDCMSRNFCSELSVTDWGRPDSAEGNAHL